MHTATHRNLSLAKAHKRATIIALLVFTVLYSFSSDNNNKYGRPVKTILFATRDSLSRPDGPYVSVAKMPHFKEDMSNYIGQHIKVPESAREARVSGRIIARFIVRSTGKTDSVQIVRGMGYGCDEAVTEMIKNMPRWEPGRLADGTAVDVYFTIPVSFSF